MPPTPNTGFGWAARVVRLPDGLELTFVDVTYTYGPSERYQVVVQWDSIPPNEYGDIATIGAVDGHTACEALYDAPSAQLLLSLFRIIRGDRKCPVRQ